MLGKIFTRNGPDGAGIFGFGRLAVAATLLAIGVGGGLYIWQAEIDLGTILARSEPKPVRSEAEKAWQAIRHSTSTTDLNDFVGRFPDTDFARFAEVRLNDLESQTKVALQSQTTTDAFSESENADLPEKADPEKLSGSKAKVDEPELARVLQKELKRVGCNPNKVDGRWDDRDQEALKQFNKYANLKLDIENPSHETIYLVQQKTYRVCPSFNKPGQDIREVKQQEAVTPQRNKKPKRRKVVVPRKKKIHRSSKRKSKANACEKCLTEHSGNNGIKAVMCQSVC